EPAEPGCPLREVPRDAAEVVDRTPVARDRHGDGLDIEHCLHLRAQGYAPAMRPVLKETALLRRGFGGLRPAKRRRREGGASWRLRGSLLAGPCATPPPLVPYPIDVRR